MRFHSKYSWRVIAVFSILGLIICTILYVELQQAGILPLLPHYTPLSAVGRIAVGVLAILLVFFAGGLYWQFPIVQCDQLGISIRRMFNVTGFSWNEVKSINLISHESAIDTLLVELTSAKLALWVSAYANARELRVFLKNEQPVLTARQKSQEAISAHQFLNERVSGNKAFEGRQKSDQVVGGGTFDIEFSGNVLFSGMGFLWILMIGMAGFFGATNSGNIGGRIRDMLSGGFFIALWSLFFSYTLNYFVISQDGITIRNHVFFWKVTHIPFVEIEDAFFHPAGRGQSGLRLITHDFQTYDYTGASLGEKEWSELMKSLQGRGFNVSKWGS